MSSKGLAFIVFLTVLPFVGFYIGRYVIKPAYHDSTVVTTQKPSAGNSEFTIKKSAGDPNYKGSYKYELWKADNSGGKPIYSIINWFGFSYDVSDDKKYIAILNYGESMGDEKLTIIRTDGKIVKDFADLRTQHTLVPFSWTGHFYWLSEGIPLGESEGITSIIRVDADTLKMDRFVNTNFQRQ